MNLIEFSRILCMSTILFMFVTQGYSALHRIPNSEDTEHPGLCHYNDIISPEENRISLFLKPGETKKHPKECSKISCEKNFEIVIAGCGVAVGTEKCPFVVGEKTDPYPECCGSIKCIDQ